MVRMTARQPRRARRRSVPAQALPRPGAVSATSTGAVGFDSDDAVGVGAVRSEHGQRAVRRPSTTMRQHHVTEDYSHVHRDLLLLAGIGVVTVGFIIGMSFVV